MSLELTPDEAREAEAAIEAYLAELATRGPILPAIKVEKQADGSVIVTLAD